MGRAPSRYREIADELRRRIGEGRYPVGTKLPSIAELMQELEVPALNTVRAAQEILIREGLLRPQQGVGVWVVSDRTEAADRAETLARLRATRDELDQLIAVLERQERKG